MPTTTRSTNDRMIQELDALRRHKEESGEVLTRALELIATFTAPPLQSPCTFSPLGHCMTHGFELAPGEKCPHLLAHELLVEHGER